MANIGEVTVRLDKAQVDTILRMADLGIHGGVARGSCAAFAASAGVVLIAGNVGVAIGLMVLALVCYTIQRDYLRKIESLPPITPR